MNAFIKVTSEPGGSVAPGGQTPDWLKHGQDEHVAHFDARGHVALLGSQPA